MATAEAHKRKLAKNALDCGADIYPTAIRVMNDAAASPEDPAYDILALNDVSMMFYVHTGLRWTPCPQTFAILTERSSTIEKLNGGRVAQGIIDAGYTGEILIRVTCLKDELDAVLAGVELCIAEKKAIAQMITIGFLYPGFEMVSPGNIIIPMGGRGESGFGSTDKV